MEDKLNGKPDKSYIWASIDIDKVRRRIEQITHRLEQTVAKTDPDGDRTTNQKSTKPPLVIVIVSRDR